VLRNRSNFTRLRNPQVLNQELTFPGDSLTLSTNTELRLKPAITVRFPGVGGEPGLIFDGGCLNLATSGVFTVKGVIQVDSVALIDTANDDGELYPNRKLNLLADLRGAGTIIFLRSSTNLPHTIAGDAKGFSGKWLITSGWIVAGGKNSLGTNNITIDPEAPLGLSSALSIPQGPAVLEVNYDLKSAGALTLKHGGMMHLHQNCVFSAADIEGSVLVPGIYPFAVLAGSFPKNFLPGGSGSITVQPFGAPVVAKVPAPPPTAVQPKTEAFKIPTAWYVIGAALVLIIGMLVWLTLSLGRMASRQD
jgi:hypothetical protein